MDGVVYPMSIVTVSGCEAKIVPFEGEVHSTAFYSGTVEVRSADGRWWRSADDGKPVLIYKPNENQ